MKLTPLLVLVLSIAGALPAQGADDAPVTFPAVPGARQTFRSTTRLNDAKPATENKAYDITPGPTVDGHPTFLSSNLSIVAARPDGHYILGLMQNKEAQLYKPAALMLPRNVKQGDKWEIKLPPPSRAYSAVCLGSERVTVPAGTFDAVKVYGIAASGQPGDRAESTWWYAPRVGLVKTQYTDNAPGAGGAFRSVEGSEELVEVKFPAGTPEDNAAARGDADRLFAEAQALAKSGDHPAALAKYDAAIARDPKAAKVLAYKAVSLTALKQFDEAEKTVNAALAIAPKDVTALETAGQIQLAQGKTDAGKALFDQAAAASPKDAGAIYLDLAASLAARRDDALATQVQAALEKSATADPPHPDALFSLGQSFVSAGMIEGKNYLKKYLDVTAKLPEEQRNPQKIQLAKQLIRAIDAVKNP
ncbi:MAG: tetratricopeptide repeat protein [Phycisphaerae bacterium]|nr:tetratricopeptide repeat protein [Tepidisphaeraceae bacterium]